MSIDTARQNVIDAAARLTRNIWLPTQYHHQTEQAFEELMSAVIQYMRKRLWIASYGSLEGYTDAGSDLHHIAPVQVQDRGQETCPECPEECGKS